jgi:calpain-15
LIERIFLNHKYNYEGVYKIRLCLGGEWEEIMIDDYIPCYPRSGPIFSQNKLKNEIWLLLLEKAMAKINGSYRGLLSGCPTDALYNLTGFPTFSMTLRDESIFEKIQSGDLWNLLTLYHS